MSEFYLHVSGSQMVADSETDDGALLELTETERLVLESLAKRSFELLKAMEQLRPKK